MELSDFIQEKRDVILAEWERYAGTLFPELNPRLLRDHAAELLSAIIADMQTPQTNKEQIAKSKGEDVDRNPDVKEYGQIHAIHRLETGFTLFQLVSEYRYLRACILRLWEKVPFEDRCGVTRFNETIDEALVEAVHEFSTVSDKHRNELLGILGHDLRNPLGAIIMGATVLTTSETLSDKDSRIATRIGNSAKRMHRMIDYLLDLSRIRADKKLPLITTMTDIEMVCRLVIAELGMTHPHRIITFQASGDLHGRWDGDRLAQVISNLVANALQHSTDEVVVKTYEDEDHSVVLEVHNAGQPIRSDLMETIFERLITQDSALSSGLGLGLYIAREIVEAHRGCIQVTSTAAEGTTFIVRLPRQSESQRPAKCPPPIPTTF